MNVTDCIRLNRYDWLIQAADRHEILSLCYNKPGWRRRAKLLQIEASVRCINLLAEIERLCLGPDIAAE